MGDGNDVRLAAARNELERLPHSHRMCLESGAEPDTTHVCRATQRDIVTQLQARSDIDVHHEIERRRDFLCRVMQESGRKTLVLGISGGVDSTVAGRLAQLAVNRLRDQGEQASFVAMRLPYGEQKDADDADKALKFIQPDQVLDVNIKSGSDALLETLESSGVSFGDAFQRDFILGNIKARQRMVAQYAVAGARSGLVVGTDQAAEALMGFFTKYGDGACDVAPLTGLNKRQVRLMGNHLGAAGFLLNKAPTADLESLAPLKPDEEALGVTYQEVDDFLENLGVSEQAFNIILKTYRLTEHKRQLPMAPD